MTTMIIITIIVGSLLILLSYTISHKNVYPITFTSVNDEGERRSQYECGLEPFEEELGKETRERFYIKFYIIGILFLIFDLETLLAYPAALLFYNFPNISTVADSSYLLYKSFSVFLIFILLLILGLYYEYRKDVL